MMDGIAGGENDRAAGSERQSHQTLSGDFQARFGIGRDFHDTARSGQRSCDVDVAVGVEGQSLRPPQSFIERADVSARIDFRRDRWDQ